MSAAALLHELDAAGVRLSLADDSLRYETQPGVPIAPYVKRIMAHKLALMAELLKVRIVAVVTVPPERFDRNQYDALWSQLHDLENAT